MHTLEKDITALIAQNKSITESTLDTEHKQNSQLKQQASELAVLRELEDNAKQLIEENERLTEIIQANSHSTQVLDFQNKIMLAEQYN